MASNRNWSNLIDDIIHEIYDKIPPDLMSYFHFPLACKNWYSCLSQSYSRKRLPWLVECENPWFISTGTGPAQQQKIRCYSFASARTCSFALPHPSKGIVYKGSDHGSFLVESEARVFYLVNPLLGRLVLPIPAIDGLWIRYLSSSGDIESGTLIVICRHLVSTNSGEWAGVLCEKPEMTWKVVTFPLEICRSSCTACWWRCMLCVTQEGSPTAMYAKSGDLLHQISPPGNENEVDYSTYLMVCCGDLLRVSRYFFGEDIEDVEAYKFQIYKLHTEEDCKNPSWIEISNIGSQLLFLESRPNGYSIRAPPGNESNCIYFICGDRTAGKYDISTGVVKRLECPFQHCSWFLPLL